MSYDPMVANASPKELVRMVLADNDASDRELRLANLIGEKLEGMQDELEEAEDRADRLESEREDAEARAGDLEDIAQALKDSLEDALPFVESAGESALAEKIKDRLSRADREL